MAASSRPGRTRPSCAGWLPEARRLAFAHERIDEMQQWLARAKCEAGGREDAQHGLAQELQQDMPPAGAVHLAQGDLARPARHTGQHQIDVVGDGDQQDQEADQAGQGQPRLRPGSERLPQMDLVDPDQWHGIGNTYALENWRQEAARDGFDIPRQPGRLSPRLQPDIGLDVDGKSLRPIGLEARHRGMGRQSGGEDAALQIGFRRAENPPARPPGSSDAHSQPGFHPRHRIVRNICGPCLPS